MEDQGLIRRAERCPDIAGVRRMALASGPRPRCPCFSHAWLNEIVGFLSVFSVFISFLFGNTPRSAPIGTLPSCRFLQFSKMFLVAGHAGRAKRLDQSRRAGQRVGQDPDHRLLDLPGGEPPALRAIRSGLGPASAGGSRWDREFADSSLEEAGFEPLVPPDTTKFYGRRTVPLTTISIYRLPHREQTSRSRQSTTGLSGTVPRSRLGGSAGSSPSQTGHPSGQQHPLLQPKVRAMCLPCPHKPARCRYVPKGETDQLPPKRHIDRVWLIPKRPLLHPWIVRPISHVKFASLHASEDRQSTGCNSEQSTEMVDNSVEKA